MGGIAGFEGRCRVCGLPLEAGSSEDGRCPACMAAGDLLSAEPEQRWSALDAATSDSRRAVLLAFLRGGRLWDEPGPDGREGGEALARWLVENRPSLPFLRYLAEDARYGHLAWARLCRLELRRCLQRAPSWLATGQSPELLVRALSAASPRLEPLATLAFRVAGTPLPAENRERFLAAVPRLHRWWVGLILRRARPGRSWHPSPEEVGRAPWRRRWPLQRLQRDGVLACPSCGEPLPAGGPCPWCGAEAEPGAALRLTHEELLDRRALCPRCGIDLADAGQERCPGCGLPRPDGGWQPAS